MSLTPISLATLVGQGLGYTCWSAYYQAYGASFSFLTGGTILLTNLLLTKFPKAIGSARLHGKYFYKEKILHSDV